FPSGMDKVNVHIHNLEYVFNRVTFGGDQNKKWYGEPYTRIFDQMPGHYLIRAYAPVMNDRNLMIQVVMNSTGTVIKSWQEVWY
ncbi:MAG: hypothetical protein IJQ56_04875, partial [Synergistaceae bacterium]|nr:hypothetical protein [Synergistaceae bacterium]